MDKEKKILIVDDEPDAIEFTKAVISEIGNLSVVSAFDGASGLEKAKTELPDLIILDVMMPKRVGSLPSPAPHGFSVFDDLRRNPETKDIPVIMLTGVSGQTGIKFSGGAMGEFFGKDPDDFIDKPVDPDKLQKAVKKVLGI